MKSSSFLFSEKIFLDGNLVRYFIRKQRLRQKQVAQYLKVSEGQFTQYLNGTYHIPPPYLNELSHILKSDRSNLVLQNAEPES